MKELNKTNLLEVSGAGDFSYGEMTGIMSAGAFTGGLAGSAVGGVGAVPGAVGGAVLAGIGYATNQLVQGYFDDGASWPEAHSSTNQEPRDTTSDNRR